MLGLRPAGLCRQACSHTHIHTCTHTCKHTCIQAGSLTPDTALTMAGTTSMRRCWPAAGLPARGECVALRGLPPCGDASLLLLPAMPGGSLQPVQHGQAVQQGQASSAARTGCASTDRHFGAAGPVFRHACVLQASQVGLPKLSSHVTRASRGIALEWAKLCACPAAYGHAWMGLLHEGPAALRATT